MSLPLLEGGYEEASTAVPDSDNVGWGEIRKLEDRIDSLERSLMAVKLETKRDAVVMLLNLLGESLRQVASGKLDIKALESSGVSGAGNSKWEVIKQRNPGRIAQAIDVLLIHGTMNTSQLAAAMRMDRSNCGTNVVTKLRGMGLIIKNGNEFTLREL